MTPSFPRDGVSGKPGGIQLVDTGPDRSAQKYAMKALAACQENINQLRRNETLVLLAYDATSAGARIIAVTNRGVAAMTKRKIETQFSFHEIAETKLLRHPRGIIVVVETHHAQNDFLPDDWRRHEHTMQFFAATPGAAKRVCGAIDPHLN